MILDWSGHRVLPWPRPCRLCGGPALMTDADGVPCHKVCAEAYAAYYPDDPEGYR